MTEVRSTYGRGPAYRYVRKADRLPRIDDVPDDGTAIAKVRLFNPTGRGTWWIAGYDPESGLAFGVAEITDREFGYFSLEEIVAYRGRFGLPIERDLHFTPTLLREV